MQTALGYIFIGIGIGLFFYQSRAIRQKAKDFHRTRLEAQNGQHIRRVK